MIIKLLNILKDYSISLPELNLSEELIYRKPSHIGFDIENNIIKGIKIYFKANGEVIQNKYGIITENYEESFSISEALLGTEKNFRWICRPPFEEPPYSNHKEVAFRLLSEIGCTYLYDDVLSVADIIQSKTNSKRYPLVGYGAVQSNKQHPCSTDIKLYYTFWQAQEWNSMYASNIDDISFSALSALKEKMFNQTFRDQVIGITQTAFIYDNLISMYAVNISINEISEKLYFVTDDNVWLDSLSSLHKFVFNSELSPKISNLFKDITKQGFRYEEIAYSVKQGRSNLMAYFMI